MPRSKDPATSLGFLLNDVARLLRRNFNRRARGLRLTQAQCRALAYVARNEGIRQIGLAEILEVQPITLARLLDQLARAGLIERRPDPRDRRAFRLFLTPAATPLLEQIHALGAATRAEATAGLGRARLAELTDALESMKRNLLAAEPTLRPRAETDRNARPRL
jgi:DNA-binding MarR family transcriptional regulator